MTVSNFLLMTGQDQQRKKIYRDWADYIYVCDAAHGTALTDPYWKVKKIALDGSGDVDEIWNTDWYDNKATDLVTVQALLFN